MSPAARRPSSSRGSSRSGSRPRARMGLWSGGRLGLPRADPCRPRRSRVPSGSECRGAGAPTA
eukprot:14742832-Alexandrium_andersonii.AAC.1